MPPSGEDRIHPQVTRRNGYRYQFTAKHHGGGGATDAQWLPTLSDAEEFGAFNDGDYHELLDSRGNLFGAVKEGERSPPGTWNEQAADCEILDAASRQTMAWISRLATR